MCIDIGFYTHYICYGLVELTIHKSTLELPSIQEQLRANLSIYMTLNTEIPPLILINRKVIAVARDAIPERKTSPIASLTIDIL